MSNVGITGYTHGKRKLEPNFVPYTRTNAQKEKRERKTGRERERERRKEVRTYSY